MGLHLMPEKTFDLGVAATCTGWNDVGTDDCFALVIPSFTLRFSTFVSFSLDISISERCSSR
jgi:hypothetical protein